MSTCRAHQRRECIVLPMIREIDHTSRHNLVFDVGAEATWCLMSGPRPIERFAWAACPLGGSRHIKPCSQHRPHPCHALGQRAWQCGEGGMVSRSSVVMHWFRVLDLSESEPLPPSCISGWHVCHMVSCLMLHHGPPPWHKRRGGNFRPVPSSQLAPTSEPATRRGTPATACEDADLKPLMEARMQVASQA